MAALLVDERGAELLVVVFTGCVDVVGARSLGAGSFVVLGTGLLAASSSVVFSVHVEGSSAITGVGVNVNSIGGCFEATPRCLAFVEVVLAETHGIYRL